MNQDDISLVRENLVEWAAYWGNHSPETDDAVQAIDRISQHCERAYKAGQESILKAAHELLGTRPETDLKTIQSANQGQQATNTIQALSDWCDLDQTTNRFDCGKTSLDDPLKQYKVVLWNTPNHGGEAHTYIFGSTMADVMAKAAQFCLLEIDHAKRSGK